MEYIPDSLYIQNVDTYQEDGDLIYYYNWLRKNFLLVSNDFDSNSDNFQDVQPYLVDILGTHVHVYPPFDLITTATQVASDGTTRYYQPITYDYSFGVFFLQGTDKYYTFDNVHISFDSGMTYITYQQYLADTVGEDDYNPGAASLVVTIKLILNNMKYRFYQLHDLSHDILLSGGNIGVPQVVTLKCIDGSVMLYLSSCIFTDLVNSPLRSTMFNVNSLILDYPCSIVRDAVKILYATDINDLYKIAGHDWEDGVFDMYRQIFGILGFDWYTELFTRITTSDAYLRMM
jgi:hypothetical protein